MSPIKRYAKKQAKARQRRRLQAHERLERDRRQAQRAAEALHQAIEALGLPEDLVAEIEGRLAHISSCATQCLEGLSVGDFLKQMNDPALQGLLISQNTIRK